MDRGGLHIYSPHLATAFWVLCCVPFVGNSAHADAARQTTSNKATTSTTGPTEKIHDNGGKHQVTPLRIRSTMSCHYQKPSICKLKLLGSANVKGHGRAQAA